MAATHEESPLLSSEQTKPVVWLQPGTFSKELHTFVNLFWPLWLTQLLETSMVVVNVVSVGHLGAIELASVQLSAALVGALGRGILYCTLLRTSAL